MWHSAARVADKSLNRKNARSLCGRSILGVFILVLGFTDLYAEAQDKNEMRGKAAELNTTNCQNLFRNSGFTQRTNLQVPDYWDVYRVAAIASKSLHDEMRVDEQSVSPISGTKVFRIVNSNKNFRYMYLVPVRIQEGMPPGQYVVSLYVRSEKENSTVRVFNSWQDKRPESHRVSSIWRRISTTFWFSGAKGTFLQPLLNFPDNDTYQIAAPQLEAGNVVTKYHHSCADRTNDGAESISQPSDTASALEKLMRRPLSQTGDPSKNVKKYIMVDGKPFYIIGIAVGNWGVPPDWYFEDLHDHGINTIFYLGIRDKSNVAEVESFVAAAERHQLKVVIGQPMAGHKPLDWRLRLQRFAVLIETLKFNSTIIGWYPVDEPEESTWTNEEVREIFETVKRIDPHRFIFVNWAYSGIPKTVGEEPRGTLEATDVYSIDDYPFAVYRKGLFGYTDTTLRALETSRLKNKISHSWLQIYGDNDAWREPTGDELNYMAYLNLLYGGMFSYWNTKSNSAATWSRVARINTEALFLAQTLFTDSNAAEIKPPTLEDGFFHSVWRKGEEMYLIVVNSKKEARSFELQSTEYTAGYMQAISIFENRLLPLRGQANISDSFQAFESKVYLLSRQSQ